MSVKDLYVYLVFDYSQIEIRELAEISGDKLLISQFASGADIHCQVGRELTGWPIERIAKDHNTRRIVKGFHFSLVYGTSEDGMVGRMQAEGLKVTKKLIHSFFVRYFKKYKGVATFMQACRDMVDRLGYVETLFGFRRHIRKEDDDRKTYWANQAVNCVDYQTEALTNRGWLGVADISLSDKLLTKNSKTGEFEWHYPTDIRKFPNYDGEVHEFKSRSFSAVTTPEHRWLVRTYRQGHNTDRCVTSTNISNCGEDAIHRTGVLGASGSCTLSDDELQLIGWVLTDGWYKKGYKYIARTGVAVCQSRRGNPEKVAIIDALFKRLSASLGMSVSISERNNEVSWTFYGAYSKKLREMFPDRILTPEFLSSLNHSQAQILMETMMLGDGTGGSSGGSKRFCCRSKRRADMFQMLCTLAGYVASIQCIDATKRPKRTKLYPSMTNIPHPTQPHWTVSILQRTHTQVLPEQHTVHNEKRAMWCPIVPNGYFVARRNDTVYVTGNTPVQGSAHTLVLIALALLSIKPKTYHLLQDPIMEVHDALYWRVRLRDLQEAYRQGKELLEHGVILYVLREFKRKLLVPLVAESKAGFCLGSMVDYHGEPVSEFLPKWRAKHIEVEKTSWEKLLRED